MDKRIITMPDGQTLELEYTEEFYDKIRQQFGLGASEVPTDSHVKTFIWGACKTAVDRAEQEMRQDGRWKDSD